MTFLEVLKFEFKNVIKNIPILMTSIGAVILYSFFYPQPYTNEVVQTLRVSVVDLDKSDLSRKLIFSLNSSPQIEVYRQDLSSNDAKKALLENKVSGLIIIPAHFKKDLLLKKSPTIALGADANYFLIYGSIVEGALKSILTQAASIKVSNLLLNDVPLESAKESFTSFSLKSIYLFNPDMSYTYYIIPAVFVLILQQTIIMGLGMLGASYNENKYKVDASIWMKISSRVIIFGSLLFINTLYYFGFTFEFFHIPHLANLTDMLTLMIPFILSTVFLGILFGALLKTQELVTPIILFTSLPIMFSAGFVWPIEAIPEFITYLSLFFPCTPAIQGFLKLNQMGADFESVLVQYGILWLQAILYLLLTIYVLRRKKDYYN